MGFTFDSWGELSDGQATGGGGAGGPAALVTGDRDRDVLADIAARLEATGEFADVAVLRPGNPRQVADQTPTASVARLGRTPEKRIPGDPVRLLRTVKFRVAIEARAEEEDERFDLLDRLDDVARNAIEGRCLAGLTFPHQTTLKDTADDPKARNPTGRITIDGEATYLIEAPAGHATAP